MITRTSFQRRRKALITRVFLTRSHVIESFFLIRTIAIVTCVCFLYTSVVSQALYAMAASRRETGQLKTALNDYIVPQSYGRVTDSHDYGSRKVIVAIQDLHCHPEVQKNISNILSSLDKKYRLNEIFVEGAHGSVDTSWLCAIKDQHLKAAIRETLLEQGRLTGTEYYSSAADRPHLLKGLEDERLHRDNIVRLGKILDRKSAYEKTLRGLEDELQVLQAKHFSRKNLKFNELTYRYQEGSVTTASYYRHLKKYADEMDRNPERFATLPRVNMDDYPAISAYLELSDTAKQINYKKVSRELRDLTALLKSTLPYADYRDLLERSRNFSELDGLYVWISQSAAANRIDLSEHFPELVKYIHYAENSRHFNPVAMISEERKLVAAIRGDLAMSAGELDVSFLSDFLPYFKDYLLTRLSAGDYIYFMQKFDKFKMVWGKYASQSALLSLTDDFTILDRYYQVNCKRNDSFVTAIKLGKDGTTTGTTSCSTPDSLLSQAGADPVVLIAGGFHTEGLKKLLDDRKISYIIVTPNITQSTRFSDDAYIRFARQQAKLLSQALALGLASQMSSSALLEMTLNAADKELQKIGFNEPNFKHLVNTLRDAVGENSIISTAFAPDRATITFANGRTITLTRGRTGSFAAAAGIITEFEAVGREAVDQVFSVISNSEIAARDLIGLVGLIPDTYVAVRNLMSFAARHHLILGNGLIYELREDREISATVNGKIDELNTAIVARFPEFAQKIVAERQRRLTMLDSITDRSEWLRSIVLCDIVRDSIIAIGISPSNIAGRKLPGEIAIDRDALLKLVENEYGIAIEGHPEVLDGGIANQIKPLLIDTSKGKYVLKAVGKQEDAVELLSSFQNRLVYAGLPVPRILQTKDAKLYVPHQGTYFLIESFMDKGKELKMDQLTEKHYRSIGQMAATIQNICKDFQPNGQGRISDLEIDISKLKSLKSSIDTIEGNAEAKELLNSYYDLIIDQYNKYQDWFLHLDEHDLRKAMVHDDLYFRNLRFDENGTITSVYDFGNSQYSYRVAEFNNMILGKPFLPGPLLYDLNKFKTIYRAYDETLEEKLTDDEKIAIIQIMRERYLYDIIKRFAQKNWMENVFKHPELIPLLAHSLKTFETFVNDEPELKRIINDPLHRRYEDLWKRARKNFPTDSYNRKETEYKLILNIKVDKRYMNNLEKELKNLLPDNIFKKITRNLQSPYITLVLFEQQTDETREQFIKRIGSLMDDLLPAFALKSFTVHPEGVGIIGQGAVFIPMYMDNTALDEIEGLINRFRAGNPKPDGMITHLPFIPHATYGYITQGLTKDEKKQLFDAVETLKGKEWGDFKADKVNYHWAVFAQKRENDGDGTHKEYVLSSRNMKNIITQSVTNSTEQPIGPKTAVNRFVDAITLSRENRDPITLSEKKQIFDGVAVSELLLDSPRSYAKGEVHYIQLDKIDCEIVSDGDILARDFVENPLIDNDPVGGYTIQEWVQKENYPAKVIAGFNLSQGHSYIPNVLSIENGKIIMRTRGKRGIDQADFIPPSGDFYMFSFDPDKKGIYKMHLDEKGTIHPKLSISNGFTGTPLIINGIPFPLEKIKFQKPCLDGLTLDWVGYELNKRQSLSAYGYNDKGELVIVSLAGDTYDPVKVEKEPVLQDIIDIMMKLNVKNAVLGGTSGDVQRYHGNGKNEVLFANARKDSRIQQCIGTPWGQRKLGQALLVETKSANDRIQKNYSNPPKQVSVPENGLKQTNRPSSVVTINWHHVTSANISNVINKFGPVNVDAQVNVFANLYFLDHFTGEHMGWKWQNTGTNINGKPIWVSTKAGALVFCADNGNSDVAAHTIQEAVTGKKGLQGSKQTGKLISGLLKSVSADMKTAQFKSGLIIDHSGTGRKICYSDNGAMIVDSDHFTEDGASQRENLAAQLGRLISERNAESIAMGRNVLLYLDSEFSPEKNVETLFCLKGQQIVVDDISKAKAIQEKLSGIQKQRRIRLGIQVYAKVAGQSDIAECMQSGLAGCVVEKSGQLVLFDFAYSKELGIRAELVAGKNAEEITSALRKAKAPCYIIKISGIAEALVNDRDIIEKVGLTHLLGDGVLAFFGMQVYNERFVRNAAYGADSKGFDDTAAVEEYLNVMRSRLKEKWGTQWATAGVAEYTRLAAAYKTAVDERKLAEDWLRSKEYRTTMPLVHKQMLGKALALKAKSTEQGSVSIEIDNLTDSEINKAYQTILSIPSPKAIDEFIAMLELFDTQLIDLENMPVPATDIHSIAAILKAA